MTEIFYADLFLINGKGCVIMGHGKSKTCRYYTGTETKEISSDMVAFEVVNGELQAINGISLMAAKFGLKGKSEETGTKVDYFIYMMDEEKTSANNVVSLSKEQFCEFADHNITFAAMTEGRSLDDARKEFVSVIENADVKYIAVPWCDSMEEKGALVAANVK